jgi:hypothetical protein
MAGGMLVAGADRHARARSGHSDQTAGTSHGGLQSVVTGALAGVTMIDAAAMSRCKGIAVRFAQGDLIGGDDRHDSDSEFELVLVQECGGQGIVIGRFGEEDIVAVWRSFAESSGLPMVLERCDGTLGQPYQQIGRLRVGQVRQRRRHGLLAGRRPRFLVRRKTARLPERPVVHRGREIVGRD